MRRMLWIVLVVVTACSKGENRMEKGDSPQAQAQARAAATKSGEKPPSSDIPEWASIEVASGEPAKPTAWAPDGKKPTLVVFSASWCPGCTASAFGDRHLVQTYGKDVQIGIALQEEDDNFSKSPYARALSGVPVWSDASTQELTKACKPRMIPSACLYVEGQARWFGDDADAGAVIEAHRAGKLEAWLAQDRATDEAAGRLLDQAMSDASKIPELVSASHGRAGWQNSIAWDLVVHPQATPAAIAVAVALSRDAVASEGGIDFAHLDTYALALSKAGRVEDAAYVGKRVLAVCEAVQGNCGDERQRAEEFIAAAAARRGS